MNVMVKPKRLRLLPQTLGMRLVLILAAGLLVAHALSFALLFHERADATRSMMLANLEQDASISVALLERLSPAEREGWVPKMERRTYRYLLRRAQPGGPLASERARQVTALIDSSLGHQYSLRPRAVSASPERYEVELTLADGSPLTIEVTPSLMPLARWLPWVLAAQVTLLISCAWFAVRLVTKPLVRLADAAERLDPAKAGQLMTQEGPLEVAKAAAALNTLQARIATHVAERMQILAAISHDLQTPITRLQLRLEAMDEGESQAKLLADVTQLGQLVREGVNYARSANVALGPSVRLDLGAFLDSVVGDYQDTGKAVSRVAGASKSLLTHPQVLRRILQNLIDNALNYAGSAEASLRTTDEGQTCIDVLDRGPGVPEESLVAVLQPFYRLEGSRCRASGGTGLGLSIAQQLAQALGGTLTLANREEGGLRATVTLDDGAKRG
jgi:signal transduction histidine kinase